MTGVKHDQGKPPISLIPREALELTARVFGYGAGKYGRYNYRGGMAWSRVGDAALRHIIAFLDGEDTDPESGISHLGHAMASIAMLTFYKVRGVGTDDRPKPTLHPVNAQVVPINASEKT